MDRVRRTPDLVGIEKPTPWRHRKSTWGYRGVVGFGALLLVLWIARAVYTIVYPRRDFLGVNVDVICDGVGLSCGALVGLIVPWLSVALATAVFLGYRFWFVPRQRKKQSMSSPHELVPTAGAIAGRVVGRDELCTVVMESVQERDGRRPQLIVGGVGTGKTAVMVQLTQLLAEYKATPVPVRLRDVSPGFRFGDLACQQFQSQIHRRLRSSAEGDKIWRYLRQDDRIVVLADGLEEALSTHPDRDDHIRIAIAQAEEDGLPLIIASRPHDSLRGMDASILELEPMSEEAALQYLGDGDAHTDPRRLDWIVETAGVAEAPLYLRIAHELNREGLLSHLVHDDDDEDDDAGGSTVDTRDLDRSALRRNLLDTWITALVRGRLHGAVPLTPAQRRATVVFVAALACVGLREDRLEVKYSDALLSKETSRTASPDGRPEEPEPVPTQEVHWLRDEFTDSRLTEWVRKRLPKHELLRGEVDTRLAATWGAQLGLVEVRGDAVRFQHSVLQAYLGSMPLAYLLDQADGEDPFLREGFRAPQRPGRELLISMVLLSRDPTAQRLGDAGTGGKDRPARLVDVLESRFPRHLNNKGLDILAAALEIDAVTQGARRQCELATEAAEYWATFRASDLRTLEEAKLGFVHRFGEALRLVDRQTRPASPTTEAGEEIASEHARLHEAYRQLFRIGVEESVSYPVRHAVAQELGSGGVTAFLALRPQFLEARKALDDDTWERDVKAWRAIVMSAWLAPLLLGNTRKEMDVGQGDGVDDFTPQDNLWWWMGRVGKPDVRARWPRARAGEGADRADGSRGPLPALPISIEVALAQGFKYAANRRERHPRAHVEGRTYLSEQALDLLKRSGFWFSQLTLLQALGLWALPDRPQAAGGQRIPGPSSRDIQGAGAYGPDIRDRVRHWVDVAGELRDRGREAREQDSAGHKHRFVVEAGELVILALKTRRPERFLWIDEHGVTSKIGASAINRAELRKHHLWIPPSIGWSALHRRAQQLVADVLLLMNLADRGDIPRQREDKLVRANRRDLPPCITQDRRFLDANREIGIVEGSQPGEGCHGQCEFDLCPYPAKGQKNYHAELTEAFCRRQSTMLRFRLGRHRQPPWQHMLRREVRSFWSDMATRARR
jgi:hypothetical protein